jgi:hypothetical protein
MKKKINQMNNGAPCLVCNESHEITSDATQAAYTAIYRAQKDYGDKLPWREEREVFHKAVHEYTLKHPGKIS